MLRSVELELCRRFFFFFFFLFFQCRCVRFQPLMNEIRFIEEWLGAHQKLEATSSEAENLGDVRHLQPKIERKGIRFAWPLWRSEVTNI